jgi:NTP pyrophosphatase (non-canonical NTP hydrolase)
MLDTLAYGLHQTAVDKGFWPDRADDIFMAKQCMMIVSEVTETMEAIRKDKGSQEIVEEIADVIVRTLDLYQGLLNNGYVSESLSDTLRKKADYNKTRPERHGVRF